MPVPVTISVTVTDDSRAQRALERRLASDAAHVDIGIHSASGEKLVSIASAHEFGAEISHPGGQPYIILSPERAARMGLQGKGETRAQRSRYLPLPDGGAMLFLRKGKKGMGVTQPHRIVIPARSFIRSTADEQRESVVRFVRDRLNEVLEGNRTLKEVLGLVGEYLQSKIKAKIRSNIPPPLAAETIRRKGSTVSLIDRGILVNSIRYVVRKRNGVVVKESD